MQQDSSKLKENKQKSTIRWWLTIGSCCSTFLLGACGILIGYLYFTDLPVSNIQQSSGLFDSHGVKLTLLTGGQRQQQLIKLKDIASSVIKATIATEDRQFYHHFGINLKGIIRAMLVNFEHMSKKQGASTLTQQLARNLYLNHKRTWVRKLKEAIYALQLEIKFSKDDILEQYLNQICYGHGAYGIEAASQLYFRKDARSLTLAESAMLVGIPCGPSYYSPYLNMKNAKDRQKIVLQGMVNMGYISQVQADYAYNEMLAIRPQEENSKLLFAPYFRDYVRKELVSLGILDQVIETGGLRVYTTLDKRAQIAAEETISKYIPTNGDLQAALISIDPRNGYIKAMVGGKNYRLNQYNRVLANTRQPGSSFKPLVYLAALEKRAITAATQFVSKPTSFTYDNGRQKYTPRNYGGKNYGNIDLRHAIATSDNISAVSTIMQIGPEQVVSLAHRLGINSNMKPLPSLALGTFPVSPLEMTSAYGVFSNGGRRIPPRAVLKVIDGSGNILYEAPPVQEEQVVEPADAYVLTSLMESVFESGGTGNRVAANMKRPVAGKTGTTNTDAWTVGYTPEISTAVWVGYDKERIISVTESYKAAPIFADYTEQILSNVPPKIFTVPDNVVSVYIDLDTGGLAGDNCLNKRLETFVHGTEPVILCSRHPHSRLKQKKREAEKRSWWRHFKRWWNG